MARPDDDEQQLAVGLAGGFAAGGDAGAGAAPAPPTPPSAAAAALGSAAPAAPVALPARVEATSVRVRGPIGIPELLRAVVGVLQARGCSLIGLSVTPRYRPPREPTAGGAGEAQRLNGGAGAGAPSDAAALTASQCVSAEFVFQREGRALEAAEHAQIGRLLLEALAPAAAARGEGGALGAAEARAPAPGGAPPAEGDSWPSEEEHRRRDGAGGERGRQGGGGGGSSMSAES